MQKDTKRIKKFMAFSLVELMISLITISCIAAAFTPIITKRLSKNATAVKSGSNILSDCTNIVKGGDMCSLCYPGECVVCTRKCAQNQYLNPKTCLCVNCSTINTGTGEAANKCTRCLVQDGQFKCTGCQAGFWFNTTTGLCVKCSNSVYQASANVEKNLVGLRIYCCPEGSTSQQTCEHSFSQDSGTYYSATYGQ